MTGDVGVLARDRNDSHKCGLAAAATGLQHMGSKVEHHVLLQAKNGMSKALASLSFRVKQRHSSDKCSDINPKGLRTQIMGL